MQSNVKALTLILSLQSPFAISANNHSDDILEACPNLRDGAVPTLVIDSDISFDTRYYSSITLLNGEITNEKSTTTRDNIIFTNKNTPEGAKNLIMINSVGGDLNASRIIINAMDYTDNTITVCANEASSAALEVLASGTSRYAMKDCAAVSHAIRGGINNATYQEIMDYGREIKQLDEASHKILNNLLLSDQCSNEIRSPKNGDTILNAQDLLSLGLIDAIITDNYQMEVRADDPRIAFQACYKGKLEDQELDDDQRSQVYDKCYNQHIEP